MGKQVRGLGVENSRNGFEFLFFLDLVLFFAKIKNNGTISKEIVLYTVPTKLLGTPPITVFPSFSGTRSPIRMHKKKWGVPNSLVGTVVISTLF